MHSNWVKSILLFFMLIMSIPASAFGSDLSISKTALSLSDSKINEQLTFRVELPNSNDFHITLRSNNSAKSTREDLFNLTPEDQRADGEVSFAIEIPFFEDAQDALRNPGSQNRVRNNYRHSASSAYSTCPTPEQFNTSTTTCKPIRILVIDDETAIPGIIYSTDIELIIETAEGQRLSETINVSYRKRGSTLGIISRKNSVSLTANTDYKDSVDLCVYSYIPTEFELKLESNHAEGSNFLLQGEKGSSLEYKADVVFNTTSKRVSAKNNHWIQGGHPVRARVDSKCNGNNNVKLELYIERQAVTHATPGIYNGILTARVKAK